MSFKNFKVKRRKSKSSLPCRCWAMPCIPISNYRLSTVVRLAVGNGRLLSNSDSWTDLEIRALKMTNNGARYSKKDYMKFKVKAEFHNPD
ncbi:hypothetical protein MRB53_007037 [Persea americana]|uniref:Uncharacterized protein n=1 Tax=Persea americana TaxID=3435 RepID=A0ACC2MI42_PERAE|nr:hypothetical protein MRB53_007037 [Persea americana]